MKTLLYATTNDYKLLAANTALKDHSITLVKLDPAVPDVPEIQSSSQEEVAVDKAMKYYELLKQPLVVMDFGFFIEALDGFPGVYTKYAVDTIGVEGIINLTKHLPNKRAYSKRTIVYIDDQTHKIFSLKCPGTILEEQRGNMQKTVDLIFQVDETGKTLAEMTEDEKQKISGVAWRQLAEWLEAKQ